MTLLLLVKDILIVFMTIPFKALNKNQNKIEYYFGKEFLLKSYNDKSVTFLNILLLKSNETFPVIYEVIYDTKVTIIIDPRV